MHRAKTQKQVLTCVQMWWSVDYTLKKIKTAPVGVVAQDVTDFICIAHTQQVNFIKKRIKKSEES